MLLQVLICSEKDPTITSPQDSGKTGQMMARTDDGLDYSLSARHRFHTLTPQNTPKRQKQLLVSSYRWATEAQRAQVTCLKTHGSMCWR